MGGAHAAGIQPAKARLLAPTLHLEAPTRALVLDDGLSLHATAPEPVAGPGEAVVRVHLAGICGTDLELLKGYWRFRGVPGHEFVGQVLEAPDAAWVGRWVVGEINCSCHHCPTCLAGRPRHCPTRTVLGIEGRDGAFADLLRLPLENLHAVPDGLTPEQAVFVEPLAACFRILEQVAMTPGDRVAVLGDGRLGVLAAQVLATTGAEVLLIGRHERKLAVASSLGLATRPADRGLDDLAARLDVVVDATGSPSGLHDAMRLVRPEGTVVMKTTVAGAIPLEGGMVVVPEVRIVGSRCGPFAPALEALARGTIRVDALVSAIYPVAQWSKAFDAAGTPGHWKVLLRFA